MLSPGDARIMNEICLLPLVIHTLAREKYMQTSNCDTALSARTEVYMKYLEVRGGIAISPWGSLRDSTKGVTL